MIRFSEIGEAIRKARLGRRLSQLQLAQQLGLTQRTISHAESGRDLRLATLVEIARALDLEPLLVPRNLVPAINVIVGDGGGLRQPAIYSGDDDEVYSEGDTFGKLDAAVPNDLNRIGSTTTTIALRSDKKRGAQSEERHREQHQEYDERARP